jgi:glycosyltransferase involved in cell wall biosynthesis
MKAALITPYYYPAVRGNAVTVRRIERHLREAECEVRVFSLDALSATDLEREVAAFSPDLIHGFHGYLGGRVARIVSRDLGVPAVITLTGSDVYEALVDTRKVETHAALREAAALVVFHKSVKKRLIEHCPTLAEKTVVIPQGVELLGDDCGGLGGFPFPVGKFTFLLPAGLRPVKNVLSPLEPLAALYAVDSRVRFILAGPVLDSAYAAEVMGELEKYPFAHYLGGVGHDSIGCLYKKADVVLNTSLFEGGMANSVLEAMAFAKPVIASDIEGNRSIITEGETGFLYRNGEGFREKAMLLLADKKLRERLGKKGRQFVFEHFPPQREAEAYLQLYEAVKGRES